MAACEPAQKKTKLMTNVAKPKLFPSIPPIDTVSSLLNHLTPPEKKLLALNWKKALLHQAIVDASMDEFSMIQASVNIFAASYKPNTAISNSCLCALTLMGKQVFEFSSYMDNLNQMVRTLYPHLERSSTAPITPTSAFAVGFIPISTTPTDVYRTIAEGKFHHVLTTFAKFRTVFVKETEIFAKINNPTGNASPTTSGSNIYIQFLQNWQTLVNLVQEMTVSFVEMMENSVLMANVSSSSSSSSAAAENVDDA